MHPRRNTFAFTMIVLLLTAGCMSGGEQKTPKKPAQGEATPVNTPRTVVTIETTMGTIEAELYEQDAPKTVANFVGLASQHYYDNVTFHRIAKGFVIQGGDPTGKGSGGKTFDGTILEDELNPAAPSFKAGYLKGVLAMANKGRANTGTSQFFIMLDDVRSLPKDYTIFGRVISGMDVVDAIGAVEITPVLGPGDGRPKTPITMKSVTVRHTPPAETR
jgi:cyclophilin family peptidyl-prolyl cis-trans isomerase